MQIVQKESLLRFVEVICRHGRWSSVSRNLSLRHFPTPVISTRTRDSRTDGSKNQSFSIIIKYFLTCWSQPVSLDFANGYLNEHMCCKCSCTYASAQWGRSKEAAKQGGKDRVELSLPCSQPDPSLFTVARHDLRINILVERTIGGLVVIKTLTSIRPGSLRWEALGQKHAGDPSSKPMWPSGDLSCKQGNRDPFPLWRTCDLSDFLQKLVGSLQILKIWEQAN